MSDHVAWIKELNRRILDGMTAKRSELQGQLDEARKRADFIQRSIALLETKQAQLLAAEELQLAMLASADASIIDIDKLSEEDGNNNNDNDDEEVFSGPVKEKGKLKARIGDQRYLILLVISNYTEVKLKFIVFRSGLSEKRVKDAITADVALGVVERKISWDDGEDSYRLTEVGADLLQRFIEYRRQRGLSLPQLPRFVKNEYPASVFDGLEPQNQSAMDNNSAQADAENMEAPDM